jgi:ribosomal-protein-alanine acetyltransferase
MSAVLKDSVPELLPMSESDMAEIMEIEQSAYTHPWSEGIFRDCLRTGYSCWVMRLEATLIAYGVMSVGIGECHLLNLCVKPEMQNHGYGRAMLDYLLDIARGHDADTAFLEVRPSNHFAIRLYEKAGFNEVGLRRNYYPSYYGCEDAIILARSLI